MSVYFHNIKDAIQHRSSCANKQPIDRIGTGSLFSWKVEVLLYEEGKGWAFEEANVFQRILWKIAKYAPFLCEAYRKVDLNKIFPKLLVEKDTSSEVQVLTERMKSLWEKKTGKLQPSTEKPGDQQSSSPAVKRYPWLIRKNGDFSYLQCYHEKFRLKAKEDSPIKIDLTYCDSGQEIPTGTHGEVSAICKFLKLKGKDTEKLAAISRGGCPDVLYHCGNKVRLYHGGMANSWNPMYIYKEYASIDEVIEHYVKDVDCWKVWTALSDLIHIRADCKRSLNKFFIAKVRENISSVPPSMEQFYQKFFQTIQDMDISKLSEEYKDATKKQSIDSMLNDLNNLVSQLFSMYEITEQVPTKK